MNLQNADFGVKMSICNFIKLPDGDENQSTYSTLCKFSLKKQQKIKSVKDKIQNNKKFLKNSKFLKNKFLKKLSKTNAKVVAVQYQIPNFDFLPSLLSTRL